MLFTCILPLGKAPSKKAGEGRLADIVQTTNAFSICERLGMNRIAKWEESLKFFRQSGGQAQAKDLTQFMRTNDYEVQ